MWFLILTLLLTEEAGPVSESQPSSVKCRWSEHLPQKKWLWNTKQWLQKPFIACSSAMRTWVPSSPSLLWLFSPPHNLSTLPLGLSILEHESENWFRVLSSQLLCLISCHSTPVEMLPYMVPGCHAAVRIGRGDFRDTGHHCCLPVLLLWARTCASCGLDANQKATGKRRTTGLCSNKVNLSYVALS